MGLTAPLTNPLLDPAHLAMLAQQAQQTAPPVIRPPQADSAPPPISTSPMGSGAPPKMPAPNMPNISQAKPTQPSAKLTPQMKADALVPKMQDAAPDVPPIRIGEGEMPSMSAPSMPDVVKHIPTQLENDKGRLAHITDTGSGISQISSKIQGAMPNHPLAGKLLGGFSQGLATLGDVGLRAVAPSVDIALPGTSLHHLADLHGANKQVGADEAAQESEAQQRAHDAMTAHETQETAGLPRAQQDTHDVSQATIGNLTSEAEHRGDVKDSWKELAGYSDAKGQPLEINEATGEVRPAKVPGAQSSKEKNPQEQTYDSLLKQGLTPIQAYEKIREKPGGTTINQGTWQIDEDATTGKPVLFNSKTGQVKDAPAGVAKSGTFAKNEAKTEPAKQAMAYAETYGNGIHTGPGDEALMEKFFELAKPSTGFRMSQPQIDMLKNARDWAGSIEGHLRHATTGTWFSDEQRNQIIGTMRDLAKAKGLDGSTPNGASDGGKPPDADVKVPGKDGKMYWANSKTKTVYGEAK